MSWWTTVPELTPIAAWDAGRVSASQILDGVGSNHITPTSAIVTNNFEFLGVAGNSNLMPFTTPIPTPVTGVIAGFWAPKRRNIFVCGPAGNTLAYVLHLSSLGLQWFSSNGPAWSPYGPFGSFGVRYFVAMVTRGADSILYVNGNLVGTPVASSFHPASLGHVGYSNNGNEYNLDSDEFFHALGFWSGVATQANVQALEAAARAALLGQPPEFRALPLLLNRRPNPGPADLFPPQTTSRGPAVVRQGMYGGNGRIAGTVAVTPNTPVYRRVRLFDERTGHLVREMWSNPVTGAYLFDFLDQLRKYTVVSYDHLQNFRAVIADNITPEVMPL